MRAINIPYQDKGVELKGFVAIPSEEKRPVVILCHAWKGRDDFMANFNSEPNTFFLKHILFCWHNGICLLRSADFTDFYELLIPGLRLWVSLGCSAEERFNLQPVDVDIRINSSQQPRGCHSDQLADVVCYKTVTEQVIDAVKDQPFNLIESLAARIFECIAKQLKSDDFLIEITVTKPNHPVPHVQKGMVFKYCRRLPQKSL